MEAVYSWVKNIIYYMIFLSVVNNLLADSKYEKYIRFFAGMVLILLVVSPLTGKLHLDQQISSMFRAISLESDADDLKSRLWEMDDKRLGSMMGKYEEAVEQDVAAMAEADGLSCVNARVRIDSDRDSSTYGQVTDIQLQLQNRDEKKDKGRGNDALSPVNVKAAGVDGIQVEPVELAGEGQGGESFAAPSATSPPQNTAAPSAAASPQNTAASSAAPAPQNAAAPSAASPPWGNDATKPSPASPVESNEIINHLTGKVAQYYGIEESHIKIRWKND